MRPQPALAPALRRTAPSSLPAAAEEGLDRDEVWGRWLLARLERLYAPSSAKTGSDEDVQLQSIVIYTADVSGSLVGGTGEVIGFPRRPGGHERPLRTKNRTPSAPAPAGRLPRSPLAGLRRYLPASPEDGSVAGLPSRGPSTDPPSAILPPGRTRCGPWRPARRTPHKPAAASPGRSASSLVSLTVTSGLDRLRGAMRSRCRAVRRQGRRTRTRRQGARARAGERLGRRAIGRAAPADKRRAPARSRLAPLEAPRLPVLFCHVFMISSQAATSASRVVEKITA